ncbi:hypothetical protein STEG23_004129, partial [Scotinomys teguina]
VNEEHGKKADKKVERRVCERVKMVDAKGEGLDSILLAVEKLKEKMPRIKEGLSFYRWFNGIDISGAIPSPSVLLAPEIGKNQTTCV